MEAYISISILIIAVLCKRNYDHSANIKKLIKMSNELIKANENLGAEVKRQQQLNYQLTSSYNDLRDSILDMPPKSGRFFAIRLTNNIYLKHFSEN